MNILIVANHYAVCSARYAADAFTRLGHTVKHVGQPMGRNIWGMQVPEEYVWTPDFERGDLGTWVWWKESSGNAETHKPDIVVVMESDPAFLDWIGTLDFTPCPVIVWGVDNHVRDYRRPYFDHYFLAHKSVSVMSATLENAAYFGQGALVPNVTDVDRWKLDYTWLPCAYDPVAFPPSPIAWEQRQYDVCMIGVMYPRRWELVAAMRAAGLKVLAGTGLVYDAYRDAYHNSRVALVSSACGDLPIRLFEGAGMGCAVLCEDLPDFRYLGDGSPAPLFAYLSVEHAVATAQRLQQEGQPYAEQGIEWASRHTFDARAQVIIDWLEARS